MLFCDEDLEVYLPEFRLLCALPRLLYRYPHLCRARLSRPNSIAGCGFPHDLIKYYRSLREVHLNVFFFEEATQELLHFDRQKPSAMHLVLVRSNM